MDILQILHIPEIPGEIAISGMFPQPDKTGNFGSLIKTYIDIGTFYFLSLTSDRVEKITRSDVKRQQAINTYPKDEDSYILSILSHLIFFF